MAGLRVVRGPAWKCGDQDGGLGHLGTVKKQLLTKDWAIVLWDNGREGQYRAGADDACDITVLDNGPTGVHHNGAQCDGCNETAVKGLRWKCLDCPDYDLCTECYGNDRHDRNHRFKRIDKEGVAGKNVGRRANAVKIQSRGIHKGATVTRGDGWCKGNLDGGEGSMGIVDSVGYKQESGDNIYAVVVIWPNSNKAIHCLGWNGRVDVKCKTAAAGLSYYRDHLPELRELGAIAGTTTRYMEDDNSPTIDMEDMLAKLLLGSGSLPDLLGGLRARRAETMKKFSPGDMVRLDTDREKVRQLQIGHGGFNTLMVVACGNVGVITEIDTDGDVKVNFGAHEWCLHPETLTKISVDAKPAVVRPKSTSASKPAPVRPTYAVGDHVIITKDLDTIKKLQKGHGGWNDINEEFVGAKAAGRVLDIDDDGDITVEFGMKSFLLNPAICSIAPKTQSRGPSAKFKPGDRLRIDRDLDFAKRMQNGHGGWIGAMKKVVHRVGRVLALDCDGDLRVDFGEDTWTLNPEVCNMVKPGPPVTNPTNQSSTKKINNAVKTAPGASDSASRPPSATETVKDNIKTQTCPFNVEQKVQIDRDVDFVKRMQNGHGGWNDKMRKAMTKTGKIRHIDVNGDIEVDFDDLSCTLNPRVCHLAAKTTTKVKYQNQSVIVPDVKPKSSDVEMRDRPTCLPQTNKSFTIGDQVKIVVTADRLKGLQRGHGGWSDAMIQCIGSVGIVKNIDQDGNLNVTFNTAAYTVNPEALDSMDAAVAKDKNMNTSVTTDNARTQESNGSRPVSSASLYKCQVCLDMNISVVFNCGHGTCDSCSKRLNKCHICRQTIAMRTKLFV